MRVILSINMLYSVRLKLPKKILDPLHPSKTILAEHPSTTTDSIYCVFRVSINENRGKIEMISKIPLHKAIISALLFEPTPHSNRYDIGPCWRALSRHHNHISHP